MKHAWKATALVLCVAGVVLAGFELPRRVYRMEQIEKVKELAQKKKTPITFVYTNKDSH